MLTTANYPDILVKKYGDNRLIFFFFMIYTFVSIFIMVNMMVGVFYFNYKQVFSQSILKAEKDPDFAKLLKYCLTHKIQSKRRIMSIVNNYVFDPEFKQKIEYMNEHPDEEKTEVHTYTQQEKNFEKLQKSTFYKLFFVLMDLACGVGAVTLIQNKWVATFYIQIIYLVFSLMSAMDSIILLMVGGIRKHLKNFLMWSELISSAVILPLTIVFLSYDEQDNIPSYLVKIWGIFCIIKFVRLVFYLSMFEQVALTIRVFYQILPFLKSFLGMLTILFFFFATIGINLFGGKISNHTRDLYKAKTGLTLGTNYEYINFNDIPSAILALYVNVINNNWIYFANMFIMNDDDTELNYRWFFVIFQMITNLFVMTILVGFIIDNILQQFESVVEKRNQKLKAKMLDVITKNLNFNFDGVDNTADGAKEKDNNLMNGSI